MCHQSQMYVLCLWDCMRPEGLRNLLTFPGPSKYSLNCSVLTWECFFLLLGLSFPVCNTRGTAKSNAHGSLC